ncbi:MAG: glycosyltransferase family 2 protein [Halioglobus sp.]
MTKDRPTPLIGIIILDWDKPEESITCAESVLAELDRHTLVLDGKIVIVDNGSNENNLKTKQRWFEENQDPRIKLVSNKSNLGFAKGMNRGISALSTYAADYYWLLNNDLEITPNSILSLFTAARSDPEYCILGPTILDKSSETIQCAGGCKYHRWIGIESPLQAGSSIEALNRKLAILPDYIYGAAMFIRADFLDGLGGLDESYFLFYEELELALNLRVDQQLHWCPDSVVRHRGSKSISATNESRSFTAYHAARSAYEFTWRHYPWCLPTVITFRILGLAAKGMTTGNYPLIGTPWRALFSWLRQPSQNVNVEHPPKQ